LRGVNVELPSHDIVVLIMAAIEVQRNNLVEGGGYVFDGGVGRVGTPHMLIYVIT
jgi:hypothetical protein